MHSFSLQAQGFLFVCFLFFFHALREGLNSELEMLQSSLAASVPGTAFVRQSRHSEALWQLAAWTKEGLWHLLGALSLL